MGKKKKKKQKDSVVTYTKDCIHPRNIKVGEHVVYVLSYRDFFPTNHKEEMEKLDVFLGFSECWEKYEARKKEYKRDLLNTLSKCIKDFKEIESLLVVPFADGKISPLCFEMAKNLLDSGYKIGMGCHGAHGRTGWILAKLIMHYEKVDGDTAIRTVRERLCEECVETEEQRKDLGAVKEEGTFEGYIWCDDAYNTQQGLFQGRYGGTYSYGYGNYGSIYQERINSIHDDGDDEYE